MKVKIYELIEAHLYWTKGVQWEESQDRNYIAVRNGGSNLYLKTFFGNDFKKKFKEIGKIDIKETAEYIEKSAYLERQIAFTTKKLKKLEKELALLQKIT